MMTLDRAGSLGKIAILIVAVSLVACASIARNVRSEGELGERRVLAGRLIFLEGSEEVSCQNRDFRVRFHAEGDRKLLTLEPDEDCYVYVPVSIGRFYIRSVVHKAFFTGSFEFLLDDFPSVEVHPDDSVVNFCTLKIRFHQGKGSKTAAVFGYSARAWATMDLAGECEATQAALEQRLNGIPGPIRNRVDWLTTRPSEVLKHF